MHALRVLALLLFAAALMCLNGCQKQSAGESTVTQSESFANTEDGSDPNSTSSTLGNRYQFEGFAFEVPDGWQSVEPDREKTKAMLLKGADQVENAKGLIKIDSGPPVESTPEALAKLLADKFQGTISEDEFDIDGESAIRVSTNSTNLEAPREIFVVYRNGRAYLVMGVAVKGTDVTSPIIDIVRSWRWSS